VTFYSARRMCRRMPNGPTIREHAPDSPANKSLRGSRGPEAGVRGIPSPFINLDERGRDTPHPSLLPLVPMRKDFLDEVLPGAASRRRRPSLHASVALLRSHLTPLPAQFHAPFGRHLPEPVERFAYALLLVRRHGLELLPALAQLLALLRRHGSPLSETLLRARSLLRRHGEPALAAPGQRLLAFRRQTVPLVLIAMQQFLLLGRHRRPCPRSGGRGGRSRRSGGSGRRLRRSRALRDTACREKQTCTHQQRPYHYFASCGGVAGGGFSPRGGAFFKNSHQAASPTSSAPKNSMKSSSGALCDGDCAPGGGCVPGEGDCCAPGVGGGGWAAAAAHTSTPINSQCLPLSNCDSTRG
jgi:hypothetical protein